MTAVLKDDTELFKQFMNIIDIGGTASSDPTICARPVETRRRAVGLAQAGNK
jgi:hypothetical protein